MSKNSNIQSINPTTEEVLQEWNFMSDQELEQKVQLAEKALDTMKNSSFAQRSAWMRKAGDLMEQNARKYAETITREMGKPINQALQEMKMCTEWCRFYADNAEEMLRDVSVKTDIGKNAFISHEPLGILFQIAPFNFPFHQDIFNQAGFPQGAVQLVLITKDQSNKLIADPRIRGVSLTGSAAAGKNIARLAGENLKKQVLELGGNDAYIVCNDADLKEAAKEGVRGRTVNNGQSCVAAKRFIVVKEVYDAFVKEYVECAKQLKMGDPMKEDTQIGPLARKDLRDSCHRLVEKAVGDGAKVLLGGQIPQGMKGYFYPPTVLADVTPENTAFKEEIFAPVASIIKANDEQHAIKLANMSRYGLGGGVFTKNEEKGTAIARQLDSGMAFVNRTVDQRPQYPFGGVKESGYGKESGEAGLKEWSRMKSIIIK